MASVDNGLFIGFIAFRECVVYVYIGHCAVSRDIRGEGYGSRLLADFIAANSKTVLLEIDPLVDDVSKALLAFYRKCGFHENPYTHVHPPYRDGYGAHPLIVLTTGRPLSEEEYQQFRKDLSDVVMAF